MANISYGVNILPKINNTYTLGNSSYKWHAYLASINGQAIEELVLPAVTSSDNDKILKVSSGAWTVGDAPSGLPSVSSTDNGKILSVSSGEWTATTPNYLTSHQDITGKADKANTVLTTTLSRGRTTASTVGSGSIVFGDNVEASGMESQAFGYNTKATASWAHAEGLGSIASAYAAHAEGESSKAFGEGSHAEGLYTQSLAMGTHSAGIYTIAGAQGSSAGGYYTIASGYATTVLGVYNAYETADAWVSGTSYSVGDQVFYNNAVRRCSTANSDSSFDESHWGYGTHWFLQIGNGQNENNRSNAFAVSTGGDGKFLGDVYIQCNADSSGGSKVATVSNLPTTMTGATSSAAGTTGLVPAPGTGDVNKFLAGDGTYKSGGLPMVILSYGSSTWNDFINAYNNNVIVYCRASSNSNPASGSQTRMAFMAYVNNATSPTSVEFQYYRSVNPTQKSASQMSDQVFVYTLTSASGGTWSVTTRQASIQSIAAASGSKIGVSYSNSAVTLSNTMTADDMPMSSSDATTAKAAIDSLNSKIATQDISSNVTTDKGTFSLKQVNTVLDAVFVTVELTLSVQLNAGQAIMTGLPKAKGNYVNIFVKQGNTPKAAYMDNTSLAANETFSSGANIQINYSYIKQ